MRRVVHHLRNLTDENASSSNASGGGDDDISAFASHVHDGFGIPSAAAAAASTVCAADAAVAASSIAALGERQRQCRSIVKTLTEQQQLLLQAIEEEVSRARAQAVEAASEWTAAHGNSMRLAQQQLQVPFKPSPHCIHPPHISHFLRRPSRPCASRSHPPLRSRATQQAAAAAAAAVATVHTLLSPPAAGKSTLHCIRFISTS